jgi:hypothetical protein
VPPEARVGDDRAVVGPREVRVVGRVERCLVDLHAAVRVQEGPRHAKPTRDPCS